MDKKKISSASSNTKAPGASTSSNTKAPGASASSNTKAPGASTSSNTKAPGASASSASSTSSSNKAPGAPASPASSASSTSSNTKGPGNTVSSKVKGDKVSFFVKINKFFEKHFLVIMLVVLLIVILVLTYFYSGFFRPKAKIKKLTNNLTYDKNRERIDFCGDDNYIKDKIRSKVQFDKIENSVKFFNPNVNLYDLGLSSEYYINIEETQHNNNSNSKYYKIAKVIKYNELVFQKSEDSESIKQNETKDNVVITYFRPSSNQNIYKYKPLTDYYICSSFNSFLIGKHKLDYCDLNMINRALYFGARYLELEVLNKEVKNFTEPIVCTGIEKGNIITSLNFLMFEDCIKTIASYAFSEKAIANYNDPLFLFLNLKTGNNFNTNDRIHDIIVENLSKYLLGSEYNHVNISKLTLCELRRKLVILTNKTCPNSKLDNIITCSTDKPYLKRINMKDLDRFKDSKEPKLEIISGNVQFNNELDSFVTIFDKNINLVKSGINSGDFVQINNANNPVNNSGLSLNKIKMVNKNIITFETQGLFADEKPGAQVVIKIYDESYVSLDKGLEEFNKNNISILVPDTEFYSKNYDFKRAMYRGCQFVAMNFQKQDTQMISYFKKFQERSFKFKPEVLINSIELPKSISINTLVPKEQLSPEYKVDYEFLSKIGQEGHIVPILDNKLKLISDSRDVKFSLSNSNENSKITIVKGLDNRNDTISFKLRNRYLHTNDNCCYLYFSEAPPAYFNNTIKKNNFKQNASFIPLKPNQFKKGYNSFGIRKKHIINRENVEFLYQLRLRNYFRTNKKIYTKNINKYDIKFEFNLGDGEKDSTYRAKVLNQDDDEESRRMVVLSPYIEATETFRPLGDIIVPRSELDKFKENEDDPDEYAVLEKFQNITTKIYNGAVDKPKDYELIYDNKYFSTKNRPLKKAGIQFSIWKPIPNNGFSAVSVVFNKGYQKPSLDEVVCISNEFIKEIELLKHPLWFQTKTNLIFWKNNSNYYANVFNSFNLNPENYNKPYVPNPIDNLIFDVITEDKDFSDKLYLDKNKFIDEEDKRSSVFSFIEDKIPSSTSFGVYDYLMEIENNKGKIMSFNTSGNSKMCISLPQPYWTSLFDLRDKELKDIPFNSFLRIINELTYNEITLNLITGIMEITNETEKQNGIQILVNLILNIINQKWNNVKDNLNDLNNISSKSLQNEGIKQKIINTFTKKNIDKLLFSVKNMDKIDGELDVGIEQCKGEKYVGTNWNIKNDKTIRLKDYENYCLTYNSEKDSRNPFYGTHNKDSKLYLKKCEVDLKNQQFNINDNQISLYNPEAYDKEFCLHHNKENELKVAECGAKKYNLLWKWGDEINIQERCSLPEIENYAEDNVNHIKRCINLNYYVVYKDKIDDNNYAFKYILYCDEDEAKKKYEDIKGDYKVRALYYNNEIIEKDIKNNEVALTIELEKYVNSLSSFSKYCSKCFYPDRIICSENNYIEHKYNYTSNPKILNELIEKCNNLKPSMMKCEKDRRQKFISTKPDPNFCLKESKEVFVYIFDKDQFTSYNIGSLNIDLSRGQRIYPSGTEAKLPQRVDNLLAEPIDYENYHLFVRGILKEYDTKFYKILFKPDKTGLLNSIIVPKISYDIFLNRTTTYDKLKIGTKVLCNYSLPNKKVAYQFEYENNIRQIMNGYVRWLAVVVEKLKNNYVKIIPSINSYESDKKRETASQDKMRPFSSFNKALIVLASDLVLLEKAPRC